jgi:hypothetical protein
MPPGPNPVVEVRSTQGEGDSVLHVPPSPATLRLDLPRFTGELYYYSAAFATGATARISAPAALHSRATALTRQPSEREPHPAHFGLPQNTIPRVPKPPLQAPVDRALHRRQAHTEICHDPRGAFLRWNVRYTPNFTESAAVAAATAGPRQSPCARRAAPPLQRHARSTQPRRSRRRHCISASGPAQISAEAGGPISRRTKIARPQADMQPGDQRVDVIDRQPQHLAQRMRVRRHIGAF